MSWRERGREGERDKLVNEEEDEGEWKGRKRR